MKYDQLVQLYFERSAALQWLWTLYVVVIGGLLAISNLRVRRDRLTVILVTVLYICFAHKNLGSIHDTTMQRSATLDAIHHFPISSIEMIDPQSFRDGIEPTLVAPEYSGIRTFHVTCDVLVVVMLWAMERRRVRWSKEDAEPHQMLPR